MSAFTDGLSPRGYWIAWAVLAALAALPPALAEAPDWSESAWAILVIALPVGATLAWALRLHNAGRSGWWAVLVLLVAGIGLMVASETLLTQAGQDSRQITGEVFRQILVPTLAPVATAVVIAMTLVVGALPARRQEGTARRAKRRHGFRSGA